MTAAHEVTMRFVDEGEVDAFKHRFAYSISFPGDDAEQHEPQIQADVLALHAWTKANAGIVLVNWKSNGMMVTHVGKEPELATLSVEVTVMVQFDTNCEEEILQFKLTFGKS